MRRMRSTIGTHKCGAPMLSSLRRRAGRLRRRHRPPMIAGIAARRKRFAARCVPAAAHPGRLTLTYLSRLRPRAAAAAVISPRLQPLIHVTVATAPGNSSPRAPDRNTATPARIERIVQRMAIAVAPVAGAGEPPVTATAAPRDTAAVPLTLHQRQVAKHLRTVERVVLRLAGADSSPVRTERTASSADAVAAPDRDFTRSTPTVVMTGAQTLSRADLVQIADDVMGLIDRRQLAMRERFGRR